MASVNANINVNIQTQQAVAQLRRLTTEINNFNSQTFAANSAAAQQQRALNQALIDGVKTSGQFRTSIVPITSSVDKFSNAIDRGKLSLGQYTRYASSQLPGMRRVFTREFNMINRIAENRVKTLNTQFVALGESANGAQRALAMTPRSLDQFSASSQIALQRTQIFNKLLRDGSTQLLNWGKNTQWAGRQLMVGFTIPLGILGTQAAKVFRELEEQAISFRKVYGDMFTTDVEVEKNLAAIRELSSELTKYGVAAVDTFELANTAAQAGARGAELIAQTTEATRLAVLGQMEQAEAIKTTITLQNAFRLSSEELADAINFLNIVENQSVLSLQDVSEAIPRVAPVIQSLGGDVRDLSVMLTAMREGGVSAAEGANALKTSLARLVSPTAGAVSMAEKFGISLQKIVLDNKGDILGSVLELATAMERLDELSQQQLMSEIFGKRQYARIGALFNNITNEASQAQRVLELTTMSTRDLASTADRELSAVEDSISTKFTASLEKAKLALAPVGEEFLKALTPVLNSIAGILEKFGELPSGIKTAIVAATGIIGGIAPIVLMVTGLVANGIANIAKFIEFLRRQVATLRGNADQFKYYTSAELEAAAATASLEGKTSALTKTLVLQKPAIETLITLYQRLAASARTAAASMPATMGFGRMPAALPRGGLPTIPQARNKGGTIFTADGKTVPGSGNTDKVPAMLTPGEFVVNKEATQSNRQLLEAINGGQVVSRNKGGKIPNIQYLNPGGAALAAQQATSQTLYRMGKHTFGKYSINKNLNSRTKFGRWSGKGLYFAENINETKGYRFGSTLGRAFPKLGRLMSAVGLERKLWKTNVNRGRLLQMDEPLAKAFGSEYSLERLQRGVMTTLKKNKLPLDVMPDMSNSRYMTVDQFKQELTENVSMALRGRRGLGKPAKRKNKAEDIWIQSAKAAGVDALQFRGRLGRFGDPSDEFVFIRRPRNLKRVRGREQNKIMAAHAQRWNTGGMVGFSADKEALKQPNMLGSAIVKEWAQRRAGVLRDRVERSLPQSGVMRANRGRIVPGTGNTDTVPAMLTPGEFVVNKKATQQNLPLIQAINEGKPVNYLQKGGGLPDIGGKWVFAHGRDFTKITKAETEALRAQGPKAIRESTGALRGYSNLGFMLPEAANKEGMSPSQLSKLFKSTDPKISQRIMLPLYQSIARNLGKNLSDVMNDPKITKQVNDYSKRLGTEIGKITGKAVNNDAFYKAVSATSTKGLTEVTKGLRSMSKVTTIGTKARGGRGERVALSRTLQKSVFGTVGAQRSYYGDATIKAARSPMPMPQPSQRTARAPITYSQATSTQAMARQIMREAPGTNARQALQIARLQQMAGGGGGGGRTPTFLGMPGMGDPDGPGIRPSQSRMQRIGAGVGKFGMGAGMGLSMAGMIPMMAANQETGKWMGMDPMTVTMGLMGAGTALSLAPMLPAAAIAPVLGAVAGIGAVAITAKVLNDNMKNAAKAAADFGANVGGTANALNTISGLFGEQTPSQRSTQMQLQFSTEEQEQSFGEFQNYLGSELGQKFLQDFANLTSAERFEKLSDYIRNAIAAGVLDQDQAVRFAKTIGSALNDAVLGSSIVADLRKNFQRQGASGLLGLAEARQSEVERSTRIVSDSSEMVGAGIQIIQDYSNALALANEEFAQGTITYEEFAEVAEKTRDAQSKYSQELVKSLTYTSGLADTYYTAAPGVAAFNEEMSKILSKEQMDALKKATESGFFSSRPDIEGIGREGFEGIAKAAIGSAIASGMDPDQAIATMQEIRDNPEGDLAKVFAERAGEENALIVAAFSQTADVMAETLGLTGSLNNQFKQLGMTFLDAGGNLGEFQTFITNLPEKMRGAMVQSLAMMNPEARQRAITGGTAISGAYGEQASAVFSSRAYTAAQAATERTIVEQTGPGGGVSTTPASQEDVDRFAETQQSFLNLQQEFGSETALQIETAINSLQNGNSVDLDKWNDDARRLSGEVRNIERNFPPEIAARIGVDFTSSEDIEEWSNASDVFALNWRTIEQLNPNIDMAASMKFLTLGARGEELTPDQVATNVSQLNNAWSNLESSDDKEIRRSAMVTITTAMLFGQEDAEGNILDKDAAAAAANANMQELVDQLGGKVFKADPSVVMESIQVMYDADQMRKQGEDMIAEGEKLKALGVEGTGSMLITEGSALVNSASTLEQSAAAAVESSAKSGPSGGPTDGGGGGGQQSPLEGFVSGILDQVKIWTDASAKIGDLNKAKGSFASQVLKGEGIFDKLRNIKGMPASMLEQVLGMGPEGAMEFLDKYAKGGKLTAAGKTLLQASSAAGINQTIGMNVLGAETSRMQARAARRLRRGGASDEVIQEISGDPKKAAEYLKLQRKANNGVRGAKKDLKEYLRAQQDIVNATREEERARRSIEEITQERFDTISTQFDIQEFQLREQYERDFAEANGQTIKEMERAVETLDQQILGHQKVVELKQEEIEKLDRANEMDQRRIESHNEEIQAQQDIIDVKQRQNEMDQREIDALSRQDELRQRTSEAIQRDLDKMSESEDKIRKSYDERFKALDEVSKVNQRIINQQRQQINLSRALSEGDVYAAAQAAEEMRAESAQFSIDQTRAGLEQSMENQISGLRTSQGLTREQAEAQIANIKEQSYQTSLQIREIEDRIYQRNLEMIPLQDEIYRIKNELIKPIEDQIAQRNLEIRDYNDQIYNTNKNLIEPLEDQKEAYSEILSNYERKLGYAIADMMVAGKTREDWEKIETATTLYLKKKEGLDAIKGTWDQIVANMAEAARLAPQIGVPNVPVPGAQRNAAGGYIRGAGARDSVFSSLTPGEFVVRKSMVEKYGLPMFEKINQGSFAMPRYNVGAAMVEPSVVGLNNVSNINAPVYNTYDMKFNIEGANASPDEIASRVMTKIRNIDNSSIRRINGY